MEDRVVGGHPEVVHHAVVRDLEPHFVLLLPVRADLVVDHVTSDQPLRRIGECAHVTRLRVELRMRSKRRARNLPVEIRVPVSLEGPGIHRERRTVLLERQQLAVVNQNVGVGGAANAPLHALVVGERIAVRTKQGVPRFLFQRHLVRTRPALAEIHPAVVYVERRDHAVAVEPDVVVELRRQRRIGRDPIEDAVELGRHLAVELEVANVALDSRGLVEPAEAGGLRKSGHRGTPGLGMPETLMGRTAQYKATAATRERRSTLTGPAAAPALLARSSSCLSCHSRPRARSARI